VRCIFRQVGHLVVRWLADEQYNAARFQPKATLAEHLEEFEELWNWMNEQWRIELSDPEEKIFFELQTETERDLFRILKNFARFAAKKGEPDFPVSIKNVAARLGVSFQYVSEQVKTWHHNSEFQHELMSEATSIEAPFVFAK
jgi:hypothetical protein